MRFLIFLVVLGGAQLASSPALSDPSSGPGLPEGGGPGKEGESLSFERALQVALENSPDLAARRSRLEADESMLLGDEGYGNPELAVDVEDFLGSGAASGVDGLQVTAALSQEVQLGGKPGARRKVKEARKEVSSVELSMEGRALEAEVADAFLEVLAQESRLENAREVVALASQTVEAFELQVEAGRATPMEVDKAQIVLSLARLVEEQAQRALRAGKRGLAAVCGEEEVFFDRLEGDIAGIRPMVDLESIVASLEEHPVALARAAELKARKADRDLARANRVPDITFSLGYRWLNADTSSALVAGAAMPLPLVNRNQGPIAAAESMARMTEEEGRGDRLRLIRDVAETYHILAMERERARVLRDEIFPRVVSTFESVRDGYRLGRFGYLDLLDAQRTLFEVKEQALDAMIAYQRMTVYLSRIAALPIPGGMFDALDQEGAGGKEEER